MPSYTLGEIAGTPSTVLVTSQLPAHNHPATFTGGPPALQADITLNATATPATKDAPEAGLQLGDVTPNANKIYSVAGGTQVKLGGTSGTITGTVTGTVMVGLTGNSQPISIMQPYLALNYIIAIEGIFPSRN